MTPDARIDLEMTYSVQPCMDDRCGDIYGALIECGRASGHLGEHAHGFGQHRLRWTA